MIRAEARAVSIVNAKPGNPYAMLTKAPPDPSPARFDPMDFFAGRTKAWGVFEDRFGRLRRRFVVSINGYWQDDAFILDEDFSYDDGTRERRTWRLKPDGDGGFRAHTEDCIGDAHGSISGPAAALRYVIRLRVGARHLKVRFDDRMYRVDRDVVVNRAVVSKWGLRLGDISLFFVRQGDGDAVRREGRAA